MLTENVVSGIGCRLDLARAGMSTIDRVWSTTIARESRRLPLAPGVSVRALLQGSLCSLSERGEAVPFDESRAFGGFVERLYEDRGVTLVLALIRGAVLLPVADLQPLSVCRPVHVLEDGATFRLDSGSRCIGEVLAIESVEKHFAIVGIRLADDARPFVMAGNVRAR